MLYKAGIIQIKFPPILPIQNLARLYKAHLRTSYIGNKYDSDAREIKTAQAVNDFLKFR